MSNTSLIVEISEKELPLHCPFQREGQWSSHPRVFLDIAEQGEVKCPYCGTLYKLKPGSKVKHSH
jgi:uncharacterized Zn-finger protein